MGISQCHFVSVASLGGKKVVSVSFHIKHEVTVSSQVQHVIRFVSCLHASNRTVSILTWVSCLTQYEKLRSPVYLSTLVRQRSDAVAAVAWPACADAESGICTVIRHPSNIFNFEIRVLGRQNHGFVEEKRKVRVAATQCTECDLVQL